MTLYPMTLLRMTLDRMTLDRITLHPMTLCSGRCGWYLSSSRSGVSWPSSCGDDGGDGHVYNCGWKSEDNRDF